MKAVVSLNSGSSSIKFSLFAMEPGGSLQLAAGGKIEKIGIVPALKARRTDGTILLENGGAIFDHGSGGIVLLRAA
jgi:acetate kinase